MNHETTEFARWRFVPRQAHDPASFAGIEHHHAEPSHRWQTVLWFVACMLVSAGLGAMLAGWGAP